MFDCFNRHINYLRISVTDLCNLRCTYCMPAEGVKRKAHQDILSFEEIEAFTRMAVDMGIHKVRLTGGEPLVRHGILDLVKRLGAIPGIQDFAMTTNGVLLPPYARGLRDAGLHRVNISLDTLNSERFRQITRCGHLPDVLSGIDAALEVGFPVKLNCVIEASPEEEDARSVSEFAQARGLELRYIRQMDTAKGEFWRVLGGDGGHCKTCNRLRLSSDGNVLPCLFSDLSYNIRKMGMREALLSAVKNKPECGKCSENKFYAIGG